MQNHDVRHEQMTTSPDDMSFPNSYQDYGLEFGLSKREYMATHICASLNANPNIGVTSFPLSEIAEMAVKQTDELIKALNQ